MSYRIRIHRIFQCFCFSRLETKGALLHAGSPSCPAFFFSRSTTKVSYCMRIHEVERLHGDFERLHGRLATELTVLPKFPEGGGISSVVGRLKQYHAVGGRTLFEPKKGKTKKGQNKLSILVYFGEKCENLTLWFFFADP